jgi:hypothetical protein
VRLKDDGVSLAGMCPQILFALIVANEIYLKNSAELVITSSNDSRHTRTSLHYNGCAVDLRTRHVQEPTRISIADEIGAALNQDFDVILESDHIHIEWQPRRRDSRDRWGDVLG